MKPDKLDIKIQEAAAHNETLFTEEAWSAMEKLLDEKMPQQKKGKKKFFWWFLFSLLTAGGILLLTTAKKINTGTPTAQTENRGNTEKKAVTRRPFESMPANDSITHHLNKVSSKNIATNTPSTISHFEKDQLDFGSAKSTLNKNTRNIISRLHKGFEKTAWDGTYKKGDEPLSDHDPIAGFHTGIPHTGITLLSSLPPVDRLNNDGEINFGFSQKNNKEDTIIQKSNLQKHPKKFTNRIAFSLSFGPDISAVNLKNTGSIKAVFGAGISFSINKHLTARTGFYASRKIYNAPPTSYNPPSGFWNYYPYLQRIDADCKVYEVPIILNYEFNQALKHHWFASAGLSSYFMKTEAYQYFSKNPSGQTWYNDYSIKNKNQHFLSSLRLSAGYVRKINNRISLAAEPYINLPISGIGYGKVKLYSAGVLLTVSAKPFSNK